MLKENSRFYKHDSQSSMSESFLVCAKLTDIKYVCIIIQNMIIEDEGSDAENRFDNKTLGNSTASIPPVRVRRPKCVRN